MKKNSQNQNNNKDGVVISYVDLWDLVKRGPHPVSARIAVALSFLLRVSVSTILGMMAYILAFRLLNLETHIIKALFGLFLTHGIMLIDVGAERINTATYKEMTANAAPPTVPPTQKINLFRLIVIIACSLLISTLFCFLIENLGPAIELYKMERLVQSLYG